MGFVPRIIKKRNSYKKKKNLQCWSCRIALTFIHLPLDIHQVGSSSPAEGCEECLTIKMYKAMATPIAPTPELTGKAAKEFMKELAECRKASPEEKARIKANAQWVGERMDFDF